MSKKYTIEEARKTIWAFEFHGYDCYDNFCTMIDEDTGAYIDPTTQEMWTCWLEMNDE